MLFNFMIGIGFFFFVSFIFIFIGRDIKEEKFLWGVGMSMVVLIWVFGVLILVVLLYFLGYFKLYLDVFFEVMSGYIIIGFVFI